MTTQETSGLSRRAERARSTLQVEIKEGRFAEAERLPGERELARQLSVSRTTLRRVIRTLIAAGVLYQRHGFGTYVHRPSPSTGNACRTPVTVTGMPLRLQDLAYFPGTLSFQNVEERVAPSSPAESLIFNLAPHEELWQRSRVVVADGQPVAIDETLVPMRYRGRPPLDRGADDIPIDAEDQSALRARQRIRSKILTKPECDQLGLEENTIGIIAERYVFAASGCCCAMRRVTCESGNFDSLQEIRPPARK